ncbi:MAG TPA: 2Fe-2S iron-sulfur cluster binding domain-containing protein [Candidatus Acidoferrum sp.]|nr:2Fe-2S iron-sulfur cluster binding domain-containing protein [Candidatus Acidoferrum sp.]
MTCVLHQQRRLQLQPHETVLDCLLRHGVALSYACKAGMCQACLVRAVGCTADEESRKWIKPELQAKGYTLACKWVPQQDVGAELPNLADFAVKSHIAALEPLNAGVLKVTLAIDDPRRMFAYRPGQYLNATNPHGVTRAYSIANDYAADGQVELHIGSTAHGEFSGWLFRQAKVGDLLYLSGPAGSCHYDPVDDADSPLLLAGLGTGLAPLYGIVHDALRRGHTQDIHLYHGGRTAAQLYLIDELRALARQHANFHYHPCVIEAGSDDPPRCGNGRLEQLVTNDMAKARLASYRHYLCGSPDFVHGLRKKLYLQGARSEHIHCDPFTERSVLPE